MSTSTCTVTRRCRSVTVADRMLRRARTRQRRKLHPHRHCIVTDSTHRRIAHHPTPATKVADVIIHEAPGSLKRRHGPRGSACFPSMLSLPSMLSQCHARRFDQAPRARRMRARRHTLRQLEDRHGALVCIYVATERPWEWPTAEPEDVTLREPCGGGDGEAMPAPRPSARDDARARARREAWRSASRGARALRATAQRGGPPPPPPWPRPSPPTRRFLGRRQLGRPPRPGHTGSTTGDGGAGGAIGGGRAMRS